MRYGELKPSDLGGNVFNYHLKGLITDSLVQKTDDGDYSLTHAGRDYIVHRYEDSALSAHSIFLMVLQRGSEYLLRRRDVQPLISYTGFIHGEPEVGVDIAETAAKRLQIKTGINNVDLTIAGSTLITQYLGDELQSYSHAIILFGQTDQDVKIDSDGTGHNFWANVSTVNNILPSCADIIKMIEDKQTWFEGFYTLK